MADTIDAATVRRWVQEIARVLDIPVGTVRSRLNAARTQFRQLYAAVMQEARDRGRVAAGRQRVREARHDLVALAPDDVVDAARPEQRFGLVLAVGSA